MCVCDTLHFYYTVEITTTKKQQAAAKTLVFGKIPEIHLIEMRKKARNCVSEKNCQARTHPMKCRAKKRDRKIQIFIVVYIEIEMYLLLLMLLSGSGKTTNMKLEN